MVGKIPQLGNGAQYFWGILHNKEPGQNPGFVLLGAKNG